MNRQLGSGHIAIIILIGSLVAAGIYWLRPQPQLRPPQAAQAPAVSVIRVAEQHHQLSVTTQGTVTPSRQINIVAEVSGRVVAVSDSFTNGGFFKADDVLVTLDERDYQYRLVDADAQVAAAERELALEKGQARQAKREWRDLGSKEANALSLRQPQVKAAEAQLSSATAQRYQAQLNLQRTRIRSPFNGRILSTHVNVGQYVAAGTVIAQIYDSALAEVRLPLTDKQVALIGLPLGVTLSSEQQIPVLLSAKVAGKEQQWSAKLVRTEASIDAKTRFYFAVVEVPYPFDQTRYPSPLMMGLFVDAMVSGLQFEHVIPVPVKALVKNQFVYVVDEANQLQQRAVNILGQDGNTVWVRGELQSGEHMVVSDPNVLQKNMIVTKKVVTQK